MTTVIPRNGGARVFVKGASEAVLKLCANMIMADGGLKPLSHEDKVGL